MFFVNWFSEHQLVLNTLTIVGLLLASWLLGAWLSKAVRMADYGWKFAVIFFALFAGIVVIYRGWPPKLGIDLGGGTILVYRVDTSKTDWQPDKMGPLVQAIKDSINPGGQKEIDVRSLGNDMVQIVLPAPSGATVEEKARQAEEIKKKIITQGALAFRIVATPHDSNNVPLIERAKKERTTAWQQSPGTDRGRVIYRKDPKTGQNFVDPKTGQPVEEAEWCPVLWPENTTDPEQLARIKEEQSKIKSDSTMKPATIELSQDKNGKQESHMEVLVLAPENENYDVTGKDLRNAVARLSQEGGFEVAFSFNTEGGRRFGNVTGEHVPVGDFKYHLAIILDHVLQSAPTINDKITDQGQITGNFDDKDAQFLADIINRGSLPAALITTPEREMTTDSTLGADTIHQALMAMLIAAVLVPLFMVYYYRFAGVVAVIVLSLTILMLVAIMILVKAPFTLTALAGLALSVGMEVDNNVLIYERLREEIRHGAALRMALRNSFHRVGVVIVDANITHVLAAAVLFYVGTEQVKGFAITFLLGALLSIWATMFVAKTIFEVCERRRWVQHIAMRQWIGHTTIDFMHWFPACATFSVLITVLGIVVAVVRGKGLFDIDFTGGISVQTVFRQSEDIKDIRDAIAKREKDHPKDLPDATVTNIHLTGEPESRRFVVDTSNDDNKTVTQVLHELFGNKLVTGSMKYQVAEPEAQRSPAEKPPEKSPESSAAKPSEAAKPAIEPMPSEPPVDRSAPKLEPKASETAPARAPPAAPAPTGAKPAEPKASTSARETLPTDLPPASLVAMTGPEAVLLAQADSARAKPEAKSSAAAIAADSGKTEIKPEAKNSASSAAEPAQPKPEAKPAAQPLPADSGKTESEPAAKNSANSPKEPAQPEPKPEAKPEPKSEAKPAPAPDSSAAAVEANEPAAGPAIQASLTFEVSAMSGTGETAQGRGTKTVSFSE